MKLATTLLLILHEDFMYYRKSIKYTDRPSWWEILLKLNSKPRLGRKLTCGSEFNVDVVHMHYAPNDVVHMCFEFMTAS